VDCSAKSSGAVKKKIAFREAPTPMTDQRATRIRAHQQNLDRYCRLLAGDLPDSERQFLHKRIAEERLELERLQSAANSNIRLAFMAARALAKNEGGRF